MRLAAAALALVLLVAACGGNGAGTRFERHLKADALFRKGRASAASTPPPPT